VNRPYQVTAEDVDRVVHREYPPARHEMVWSILEAYPDDNPMFGADRVRACALRLAKGNEADLRHAIETALIDPRDVIAPAENPDWGRHAARESALRGRGRPLTELEPVGIVLARDRAQFQAWLRHGDAG